MKRFYYLKSTILLIAVIFITFSINGCNKSDTEAKPNPEEVAKMEQQFKDFVKVFDERMKPAYKDMAEAYFTAAVTSNPENWGKVASKEMIMNEILSNKDDFAKLKKMKESNLIQDELLKRELQILYNTYLSKQIDTAKLNKLTKMQTEIENKYSNFRAVVGKKKLSDNDVEDMLKTSKNSKELQEVWLAHKQIGNLVSQDVIALVKLRNEVAKELGFNNYHEMSLILNDQEPADVQKLFDELDVLTADAFKKLKVQMDEVLAKQCNIKPEELMPWHYQNRFFQEAPQIYDVDLDTYYKGKDIVKLTVDYYKSINLPIEDMVSKSDLFEKPGKNQHAFCISIDKDAKDVRVLCNVKDNSKWMETMLHEYGHAVYYKWIGENLPWILKEPAHTFTTEAIAMLFGRFALDPLWMGDMMGVTKEEQAKITDICNKTLALQQLVFSRWSQVMYRFEKSFYENPDQDLNKLWWDLVEKYQMIKRPEGRNQPDWASKIHIATSPCYYHNYHLGELFASQLYFYINDNVLKLPQGTYSSFYNKPEVGNYLIEKVFAPGQKYYWNDMIEKATGEKLTAKYYAKQFVK